MTKENNGISKAASVLRAVNHPLRQKMIAYILKNKSTNVGSIYNSLGLEQSIASQHLKTLRDAKIVKFEREGKQILYNVDEQRLQKINELAEQIVNGR